MLEYLWTFESRRCAARPAALRMGQVRVLLSLCCGRWPLSSQAHSSCSEEYCEQFSSRPTGSVCTSIALEASTDEKFLNAMNSDGQSFRYLQQTFFYR